MALLPQIPFTPPVYQMVHLLSLLVAFNSSVFVAWFSFCLHNGILRDSPATQDRFLRWSGPEARLGYFM